MKFKVNIKLLIFNGFLNLPFGSDVDFRNSRSTQIRVKILNFRCFDMILKINLLYDFRVLYYALLNREISLVSYSYGY